MPLLDIQIRGRELGRIRLGQQVATANGGKRPEKLSTFRFTTNSRGGADAVAALLGGEVRPWVDGTQEWEVITPVAEIAVVVPPGDSVISQSYELWTAGGCQRRCDSVTAHTRNDTGDDVTGPCLCPSDGKERAEAAAKGNACKPTTRLNVMLPDLPDIGVWRVESHGFYAAVELGGAAELLSAARDQGVFLGALLRLEKRRSAVPGRKVREWYVPVLEIQATVRELTTGQAGGDMKAALLPASAKAITAGNGSKPSNNTDTAAGEGPPASSAAAPASSFDSGEAQAYAQMAWQAETADEVLALGRDARERSLLEVTITIGGQPGELGEYLAHRVTQLGGTPAADDDGVVDGEVVEDGPNLETAQAAAAGWGDA